MVVGWRDYIVRSVGVADLLGELVETIDKLKARIKEHHGYLANYERRTRTSLIDPMLCALGWDVSDPSAVEIEPRTDDGWADYALLGSNGKPVIFVEAKKLAENVKSHAKQSVNYAVGENLNRSPKIQYCAVTNGDIWQVYDVLSQDLILETSVSSPDSAKASLQFLRLWRRTLQGGELEQVVEPLVVTGGEGFVNGGPSDGEVDTGNNESTKKKGKGRHLTSDEVREIRALKQAGHTYKSIQEKFGISGGAVYGVLSGRSHKDVV